MNEEISTLVELLTKYNVEIPIVQRDYAQGRTDEHTQKVRENLLKDMKKALVEGVKLDLSFVYGKEENGKFIPIDGQQRITTLFLLHLFAFYNDERQTKLLEKFTYQTRASSRKFLKALINKRNEIFTSGILPSEEIKDAEWFLTSWIYDPTIKSALVMLDDIKMQFKDVGNLAEKLLDTNNAVLTFKFLDMKDLGMEDDLYIKLNARGKHLTDLENLKAQLIDRMKELNLDYIDNFERNFDGIWTDFFWNKDSDKFDEYYYAFFGILLMNKGIIESDSNWSNRIQYDKIDKEIFDTAYYSLNYLSQKEVNEQVNKIISKALAEKRTHYDRILFHMLTTYFLKTEGKEEDTFKQWFRITKNLINNSYNIDTIENYKSAIKSLNELSYTWDNLLEFFAKENKVMFFNQEQVIEEGKKAKIILKSECFANQIYKAESHPYFNGQIRSALYLSKINGEYDEEIFEKYWKKISALFIENKSKYGNLLRRALLTIGDYTMPVSNFKTLCVDDPNEKGSTPSLKALFSSCSEIVKKLLDIIDTNEDIEMQLQKIIDESNVMQTDWRYCFIKYPNLFSYMSIMYLRLREVNGVINIIPRVWSNGRNYNLYLAALCEELKSRGIKNIEFDDEIGTYATHKLYILQYTIDFFKNKFRVKDKDEKIIFESQTIQETANYILTNYSCK